MLFHSSVLYSPVTAHGTFWTQSGNFLNRPRDSQNKCGIFTVFTCQNSDMNWHWNVSCAAGPEHSRIMEAVDEFHRRTTIRLVRHNSPPVGDYIHITAQHSGCWSHVGRIGGVSNRVQGVVKTSTALRSAPLGFPRHPYLAQKNTIHCVLSRITPQTLMNNFPNVLSDLH